MNDLATLTTLGLDPNFARNTFLCVSCQYRIRNEVGFSEYLLTGRVVCLACIAKYRFDQIEREHEFYTPEIGTPHESVHGNSA